MKILSTTVAVAREAAAMRGIGSGSTGIGGRGDAQGHGEGSGAGVHHVPGGGGAPGRDEGGGVGWLTCGSRWSDTHRRSRLMYVTTGSDVLSRQPFPMED